jgi:hypothetical protein
LSLPFSSSLFWISYHGQQVLYCLEQNDRKTFRIYIRYFIFPGHKARKVIFM